MIHIHSTIRINKRLILNRRYLRKKRGFNIYTNFGIKTISKCNNLHLNQSIRLYSSKLDEADSNNVLYNDFLYYIQSFN